MVDKDGREDVTLSAEFVDALADGKWDTNEEDADLWLTDSPHFHLVTEVVIALAREVRAMRAAKQGQPSSTRTEPERLNYLAAGRMRGEVE